MNVPSVPKYVQVEETDENAPCSESLYQKIGGSINYILEQLGQPSVGSIVSSCLSEAQFQSFVGVGWVEADGRTVTGSRYADLKSASIPDLRGYFIRGTDRDRALNPDSNTPTGTIQSPSILSHYHTASSPSTKTSMDLFSTTVNRQRQTATELYGSHGAITYSLTPSTVGVADPKPKNTTIRFFIRIN